MDREKIFDAWFTNGNPRTRHLKLTEPNWLTGTNPSKGPYLTSRPPLLALSTVTNTVTSSSCSCLTRCQKTLACKINQFDQCSKLAAVNPRQLAVPIATSSGPPVSYLHRGQGQHNLTILILLLHDDELTLHAHAQHLQGLHGHGTWVSATCMGTWRPHAP